MSEGRKNSLREFDLAAGAHRLGLSPFTPSAPLLQQRDKRRSQAREDLAAIFREMEAGNYLEPTDDEFELAVQARALDHSAE